MNSRATVTIISALALITGSGLLLGGPLSPPVGPIGSSMKTLSEVEARTAINATNTPGDADSVFKIAQPGSYYLTGNVSIVQSKIGIEVAAHNVTIDLNGFEINGNAVGTYGVRSTLASARGLRVQNGGISWFTFYGVHADSSRGPSLTDVRISLSNCGAQLGDGAVVSRCTFDGNASVGLSFTGGGTVDTCVALEGGTGFSLQGWTNLTGCTARNTTGRGFAMLFGGTVTSCTALGSDTDGFWLQSGGTISNCQAHSNAGAGILLNGGCTALNNSVAENGTGIKATNSANRIEGNNAVNSTGTGIDVPSDNNFIVRNSARGNAVNYSIPAGDYGQIITNPGNGFSSTNAWANFAY